MSEKDLTKVFDQNQDLTMSSREIAELTGKRHDNVYRDISELNDSYAKMGLLKVEDTPYQHPQNKQTYYEFQLTKMQCFDLLTGYSAELRIKVNRRWEELEKANSKLPQSFAESLRMLADQVDLNEKQAKQLEEQKPKVEFAESVFTSKDCISFRQMANTHFKFGRNILFKLMRKAKILDERNHPYRTYIDRGYFEVTEKPIQRTEGIEIVFVTRITPKGQTWVVKQAERLGW